MKKADEQVPLYADMDEMCRALNIGPELRALIEAGMEATACDDEADPVAVAIVTTMGGTVH